MNFATNKSKISIMNNVCLIEVDPMRGLPVYADIRKHELWIYLATVIQTDSLFILKGHQFINLHRLMCIFFEECYFDRNAGCLRSTHYFDLIDSIVNNISPLRNHTFGKRMLYGLDRYKKHRSVVLKSISTGVAFRGKDCLAQDVIHSLFLWNKTDPHGDDYRELLLADFSVGAPCEIAVHPDAINRILILPSVGGSESEKGISFIS